MSASYIPPIDTTATQHENTDHLAVNNSFLHRFFTLLALKTTARFYLRSGPCYPISKRLIVKTGPFVHLTEAATLSFVAAKTSVPVPRVHCSFVYRNQAYIVMERIQAEPLPKAWKTLSDEDLESIFMQLRRILEELRAIPPPGIAVESCFGGSLRDFRIPRSIPRFGPFKTIQELHLWIRDGLRPEEHPNRQNDQDWVEIREMVTKQDGPWPRPVFTHGDLNPFNILVRGNQVASIIDWEFAGWYPYYWEYTSAWYGNRTREAWQGMLVKFLAPYTEELQMDITRQRWWGDF